MALDPSKSCADMLPQFESIVLALAHAKSEKAALENASRPIFSLPPEITSYIFEIGRDMRNAETEDNILPSLYVSHVSRVWRAVAIGMPSLWATLKSTPRRSMLFYAMLVERSQTSMLDVIICVKDDNDECALLTLALSHSCRWRRLKIVAPYEFIICLVTSRLRDVSAPQLEALHIRANPTHLMRPVAYHPGISVPRIFTGGAGRLFTFRSESARWQPCCPPLTALTKLTIVSLFLMSYSSFCEMLHEASPTLTHLTICMAFHDVFEPTRCIILPSLLTISINIRSRHHDPNYIFMVLATISAPRVIVFTTIAQDPLPWAERSLLFNNLDVTRRYPMLKILRICGELGGGVLTLFPTITALFIFEQKSVANNIGNLFDPNQPGFSTLVPLLQRVIAPLAYEGEVHAFAVARLAVGLTAPAFKVLK